MPQADGIYEAATGANVTLSSFEGGADVIAAIASGSIDIGYAGSNPLTVAASQQLPIETIFVVGNIAEAEALALKNISSPQELVGKKIASPFVSTAHIAFSPHSNIGAWIPHRWNCSICDRPKSPLPVSGAISMAPMYGTQSSTRLKRRAALFWHLASTLGRVSPVFLPHPSAILRALGPRLSRSGLFHNCRGSRRAADSNQPIGLGRAATTSLVETVGNGFSVGFHGRQHIAI